MKPRALIFDIYKTLLAVDPPPADVETRWQHLCQEQLGTTPPMDWAAFLAATRDLVGREHDAARAVGIQNPEVIWPDIVRAALPATARLADDAFATFIRRQVALTHTVSLMPGAAKILRAVSAANLTLGIASNCQAYSLAELDDALAGAGLSRALFAPDLCFLSFEHGFSKPNPHSLRLLRARLQARGIAPAETLMIGDRPDNDIAPAQAQGWQTWLLAASPVAGQPNSGDFTALSRWLSAI
jgi:FMN phosphatase YigB (HAD superfamily)